MTPDILHLFAFKMRKGGEGCLWHPTVAPKALTPFFTHNCPLLR